MKLQCDAAPQTDHFGRLDMNFNIDTLTNPADSDLSNWSAI